MKPSLLLLVAFVGAVSGQWLNDRPHYFGSGLQDSAETVVQKFLARMTRSIESKDTSIISGLFQPGFIFKGCKGIYNKQEIVALLSKIPVGTKFTFTLISAQDTGASIKYTVSATGFRSSAIKVDFILNKVDQQLESGVVPACQKRHFHGLFGGFDVQDSAETVVQKFLARMERSIQSKDTAVISGLFQPGFLFIGCKETFTKQQFVDFLLQISTEIKLTFSPKSLKDNGKDIKFTISAIGLGASVMKADFIFNKADQQLKSGFVFACPKRHFHGLFGGFGVQDSAETVVQKFLARMTRSIESKDTSIINGLFQPGFIFKGCKGIYNKQQIVALLSKIPVGTKFTFILKSAQDTGASIKYTVSATGFGASAIEADFILNKVDQQLESGVVPACQKWHFHGFFGGFGVQDSAETVVQKFLARMERSIQSKDTAVVSELFQPEFIFIGCKKTFTKQQFVDFLLQISTEIKLTFSLKSLKDNGKDIKFSVSATGLGASAMKADFILNKADQQLKSGFVFVCPKRHFHELFGGFGVQDSAETVVQKFLARMERSIESKDTSIINGLFQPGFIFRGCKGTYNKQEIVALLSKIPVGTKFTFTLKSAQDTGASIKYTVSATGFRSSAIKVDFILNKVDQQLESGVVPACQKRHFHGVVGGFGVQDSAETVVQKFLARMERSIQSNDTSIISGLFQPGFIFKGCKAIYNKQQFVDFLLQMPAEIKLTFSLISLKDNGKDIKFTVSPIAVGLGPAASKVDFILNKADQQLKSGFAFNCPKRHFHGFFGQQYGFY